MDRAVRFAVCGVVGAAATTGVAVWLAVDASYTTATRRQGVSWPVEVPTHWPRQVRSVAIGSGRGIRREEYQGVDPNWDGESPVAVYYVDRTFAGLPSRALTRVRLVEGRPGGQPKWSEEPQWQQATRRGLGRIIGAFRADPVPPSPSFPGFALDTAFYSAIAFAVSCAPGLVRRHLRRVRGRCRSCSYDLSGLPPGSPCPECAATSPPH
jgi:hypothetical protein